MAEGPKPKMTPSDSDTDEDRTIFTNLAETLANCGVGDANPDKESRDEAFNFNSHTMERSVFKREKMREKVRKLIDDVELDIEVGELPSMLKQVSTEMSSVEEEVYGDFPVVFKGGKDIKRRIGIGRGMVRRTLKPGKFADEESMAVEPQGNGLFGKDHQHISPFQNLGNGHFKQIHHDLSSTESSLSNSSGNSLENGVIHDECPPVGGMISRPPDSDSENEAFSSQKADSKMDLGD